MTKNIDFRQKQINGNKIICKKETDNMTNEERERPRKFIYSSFYTVTEEEAFLKEHPGAPLAKITSPVDSETYIDAYAKFRRKRTVPVLIFSLAGIVVLIYAVLGIARWENENKVYMTAIYACVPLGIAAALCLKSYLKSAAFLKHLTRKYAADFSRICELTFYDECLTCYDRLNPWPFTIKGVEVMPYTAVKRIYTSDTIVALVDKRDKSFCILKKDIRDGEYEMILSKCRKAKLIYDNNT